MSQFCASGGQSIGVSASAPVLPMNIQEIISFRMDWLDVLAVQHNETLFIYEKEGVPTIVMIFMELEGGIISEISQKKKTNTV